MYTESEDLDRKCGTNQLLAGEAQGPPFRSSTYLAYRIIYLFSIKTIILTTSYFY